MTYTFYDDAGTPFSPLDDYTSNVNSKGMFVLSQDRNTGYMVYSNVADNNFLVRHPPALQEVFGSFESIEEQE
ncbi:MAG TPA: hypothetical protein VFZ55_04885 [Nitrososphaera sp.]